MLRLRQLLLQRPSFLLPKKGVPHWSPNPSWSIHASMTYRWAVMSFIHTYPRGLWYLDLGKHYLRILLGGARRAWQRAEGVDHIRNAP